MIPLTASATTSGSSVRGAIGHRQRVRLQLQGSERGDGRTHHHNTPNVKSRIVRIYYPFHPLSGRELEVFTSSRHVAGAVTVKDLRGNRLKVPSWMLVPEAAKIAVSTDPTVSARALLLLTELLAFSIDDGVSPEGTNFHKEERRETARIATRGAARGSRSRNSIRSQSTRDVGGAHDHNDHRCLPATQTRRDER
jgi:hypothetical protein